MKFSVLQMMTQTSLVMQGMQQQHLEVCIPLFIFTAQ